MQVKEIIKDNAIWIPSATYHQQTPKVSLIMPTYSRGKNGFFLRAVYSILNSDFEALELIIIDDASTDSTEAQIHSIMLHDKRVSCIRHKNNIGLPAISEYEGYLKSRGKYFIFAFDDFIFHPTAIGEMYAAIESSGVKFLHGRAKIVSPPESIMLGGSQMGTVHLKYGNGIVNASIIVDREVIETVGLYDPHITLSRLCDWDLWLRILEKYEMRSTDIDMGEEYGATLADSLLNSYPLLFSTCLSKMVQNRNDKLLPKNFPNYDVTACDFSKDEYDQTQYNSGLDRFKSKFWFNDTAYINDKNFSKKLFIYLHPEDNAIFSLLFSGISDEIKEKIVCCSTARGFQDLIYKLPQASAFMMLSNLTDMMPVMPYLEKFDIPAYYYTDNTELPWYTTSETQALLKKIKGIVVPNKTLYDYYISNQLTNQLFLMPVTVNKNLFLPKKPIENGKSMKVGVLGDPERLEFFKTHIYSEIKKYIDNEEIKVFANSSSLELPEDIVTVNIDFYFEQFINKWRALDIEILIHPESTENNIFYTGNQFILYAFYLNAVPIVWDEPVYASMGEEQGIIVIKQEDSLAACIMRLRDSNYRNQLLAALKKYCLSDAFSPAKNEAVLEKIFSTSKTISLAEVLHRSEFISNAVANVS